MSGMYVYHETPTERDARILASYAKARKEVDFEALERWHIWMNDTKKSGGFSSFFAKIKRIYKKRD